MFFSIRIGILKISEHFEQIRNLSTETSGQNGDVDRHTVPPGTTKRRTTANFKTKNNQNCQKIKLYRSPTTKELKKKHSSRLVGGVEMGSQGTEDLWQGSGRPSGRSHICLWIDWEEKLGSETDRATQGFSMGQ